ncbi:DUF4185 domain-containing protein [Paenibacillus montanisoli]|uniref:DUF4185 domain-containing protein n=1 Tax=Paenibacillus montanisoli TaxID=2081970 RepID=UPI0014029B01|nr:DUF4185 domain-containing protein [Paenibacillus montanisoli]
MINYLNRPEKKGDRIPVRGVSSSKPASEGMSADNLIVQAGAIEHSGKAMLYTNAVSGQSMWLSHHTPECPAWVSFDFGATYPIGEMRVWNYNQHHDDFPELHRRGMKRVAIEYSLNGKDWTELRSEGHPFELAPADGSPALKATNLNDGAGSPVLFRNALARYVRISAHAEHGAGNWAADEKQVPYCGLSAVQFYAGAGLAAEPADDWTALFHKRSGWSGSDGINSIPFNGNESSGAAWETKTLFLFGDTFVGEVDEATDNRLSFAMVNNTFAVLEGEAPDPSSISFHWGAGENGEPDSVLVPATSAALSEADTYYWLQDGTSIGGRFYCFPLIIGPDPSGPEGFQFKVHGVTLVSAPFGEHGLQLSEQEQVDTPLYYRAANGLMTYFGAAVMPNTIEAGAPKADGFVYIYGLQNDTGVVRLMAARAAAEQISAFEQWTYWNGTEWVPDKEQAVPVAQETSCEVSISPMSGGELDGKYVVAFHQKNVTGDYVSIYAGDSPAGPFTQSIPLHYCSEPEAGNGIYVYNAKGHPHLSKPGELLISYNVNTTSWEAHEKQGSVYRPRFIRLHQIG